MSRRSRGQASLCSRISWWGYVLMAIVGYVLVKHVAPAMAIAAGYAAMSGFLALLAARLGVSLATVRRDLDLLSATFAVRQLPPWS